MRDNAPKLEILALEAEVDGLVVGVVGNKPEYRATLFEALHGELSVEGTYYEVTMLGLEGAVDGQECAVGDVRGWPVHAVAFDASQVGRIGAREQQLIEVDTRASVVLRRDRRTSRNGRFAIHEPSRLLNNLENFDGTHDRRD
jgi:hypothetical protein